MKKMSNGSSAVIQLNNLTKTFDLDITRRMQMLPDRQCIPRIIKKLGLEAHKNKKAKNLSLGNRQRLGLAKAI